jgi:hypothetical protein
VENKLTSGKKPQQSSADWRWAILRFVNASKLCWFSLSLVVVFTKAALLLFCLQFIYNSSTVNFDCFCSRLTKALQTVDFEFEKFESVRKIHFWISREMTTHWGKPIECILKLFGIQQRLFGFGNVC